MATNVQSLNLLRNGKVYANKQQATQGLVQSGTNDGVAKLARYLDTDNNIKTIVGFYANANEMEEAGGGNSYYTVYDFEGGSGDISVLSGAIDTINETIGNGFSTGYTITEALEELEDIITHLYVAGDGITIDTGNTISVKVATESSVGVTNPLEVGPDGLKFVSQLDCGYFD